MQELIYPFHYHDVLGAVIRVLDDEILSVNDFLPAEHRLESNDEYEFAYTCCYLRYRGKNILLDAGFDPDTTPGALECMDVQAEDVDLVLITHGDRDHVAGLIMHDGSLTYPHARHIMSSELWNYLSQPETLDRMPDDRASFYRAFVRALDSEVELYDEETTIEEGITFIPNPGHRVGHVIYAFETDGTPLVYSADAFQHVLFAEHPDWPNVTDSDPDQAMESRRQLVAKLAESHALVLATHLPFPGMGTLSSQQGHLYCWSPVDPAT